MTSSHTFSDIRQVALSIIHAVFGPAILTVLRFSPKFNSAITESLLILAEYFTKTTATICPQPC